MKNIKRYLPEIYLIAAVFFYWKSAAIVVNWFAIGLLLLLTILLLTKNKILGIAIGTFWVLINLYMVLAMLSELSEFPVFNSDAAQLLVVGSLFIGLNLLFSGMLIYKNITISEAKMLHLQKDSNQ